MSYLNEKIKMKNQNKKGFVTLLLVMVGLIIGAGAILAGIMINKQAIDNIGETEAKILQAMESSERIYKYIDLSTDLSAKIAIKELRFGAGHYYVAENNKVKLPPCGVSVYTILNDGKEVEKCIPDYEKNFETIFNKNFNKLLTKNSALNVNAGDFDVDIKTNNDIKITSKKEIETAIYAYVESYYVNQLSQANKNDIYKENQYGYIQRTDLVSYSRENNLPSKIIILDTQTSTLENTAENLEQTNHNYHFIIQKDGKIYQFAGEDKATKFLPCTDEDCIISNDEKEIISIAMQSCSYDQANCQVPQTECLDKNKEICWAKYSNEQIQSLRDLLFGISQRNTMEITKETVQSYRAYDESKKNPSEHLENILENIIKQVNEKIAEKAKEAPKDAENINSKTNTQLTGNVVSSAPPNLEQQIPTFNGVILTTVYYTPVSAEFSTWYSGKKDNYGSYCKIPQSIRGFADSVSCQGTGMHNGEIYSYSTIGPSESNPGKSLEGYKFGRTSSGTDATPKRTVAVNNVPNSPCYIPMGTKMYIFFEEGNPYNGYYVAEDTGAAFKEKCKMDIFAGIGKSARDDAAKYVSGKRPQIYVLDKDFQLPEPGYNYGGYIPSVSGTYKSYYSYETDASSQMSKIKDVYEIAKKIVDSCKKPELKLDTYAKAKDCVDKSIKTLKLEDAFRTKISTECEETQDSTNTYITTALSEIKGSTGFINIQGALKEKSDVEVLTIGSREIGRSTLKRAFVTLEDASGSYELKLEDEAAELSETLNIGDELLITNLKADLIPEPTISLAKYIQINPSALASGNLNELIRQLSDCTTADQESCACTINYEGQNGKATFYENTLKFVTTMGEEGGTSETIKYANMNFKNGTKEYIQKEIKKGEKLYFVKSKDVFELKDKETPALEICAPKEHHIYLCMDNKELVKTNAYETNFKKQLLDNPPINFALKI